MVAHHVAAEHPVAGHFHHEFEQHRRSALRQGLGHRTEARPVDPHPLAAVAAESLLFAKPHGGQLRLAEHGTGHQIVVHSPGTVAIGAVGEGAALIDGYGGEVDAVGHIAHRKDVGHIRGLIRVHGNTPVDHLHTGRLKVQSFQEGPAARGQQHAAAADRLSGGGLQAQALTIPFDGSRHRAGSHIDAAGHHRLLDVGRSLTIKAPQDPLAPHDLDHLHTEAVEDAGEFAGDESSSHHHHPMRQFPEFEQVVADPAEIGTC